MKKKVFGIVLTLLASLAAAQSVVPVHEEPFHRLVSQNRNFRVLDILIPPGQTTLYHRHAEPAIYVRLNWAPVRAQLLGEEFGPIATETTRPGDVVLDDNYHNEPMSHRVNNTGDDGFRLLMITNNREDRNERGQNVYKSLPGEPGVDSEFFAQSRIDIGPGETVDWDGVEYQVIFVLATDTHVVMHSNRNDSFAWGMHSPGEFEFISGKFGFSFENRSNSPATIIAVAVR